MLNKDTDREVMHRIKKSLKGVAHTTGENKLKMLDQPALVFSSAMELEEMRRRFFNAIQHIEDTCDNLESPRLNIIYEFYEFLKHNT